MKLLFGEFPANYEKYHFPYQVWLVKEDGDDVDKIYEMGFLPMRSKKDFYYLCRSVRVDLNRFQPSSENRRILRKTEDFQYRVQRLINPCHPEFSSGSQKIPKQVRNDMVFDYTPSVQKICKDWFEQKFGKGKISTSAIRKIFTSGIFTHVFVWSQNSRLGSNNKSIGYAVAYSCEDLLHYAHVFIDPQFSKANLGVRMMLGAVLWAKENDKKYTYLGTGYTKSSLYKTQYLGVEFFNGSSWSDNIKELKYLIDRKSDNYLFQDKEYLRQFTQ